MRRLLYIFLLCLTTSGAFAQDAEEDKGFITRMLQDNLSGAGRVVTIDGFAGALSSRARIERLTIADATGVWFIIENIVLDWNRLALLSGRLDVNELSADNMELLRLPETTETAPSPEASVFSLPELPIAINIAAMNVTNISLAEPVLGETITASLNGALQMEGGAGSAKLSLTRTDGKTGALALDGAFANETNVLDIEFSLQEQSGGILADALDLPGLPSLDFQLSGHDPLSDFTADISLGTDGSPRFSGTIELRDDTTEEGTKTFSAALGGDVSPLFLPEYQPFFGDDTQLLLDGSRTQTGRLDIRELSLKTATVDLTGALILAEDGLPEQFNITGTLSGADDIVALLPLPGAPVKLVSANIQAEFQAAQHNRWSLEAGFNQLSKDGFAINDGKVTASGIIERTDADNRRVTADIKTTLSGLKSADPALAKAMGNDARAVTRIIWQDNLGVTFENLDIAAGGIDITGHATLSGPSDNLRLAGDTTVVADNLDRFSDLFNLPIGGKADVKVAGWVEPLGGAFDATITGHSTDLVLGPDPLPALLKGASTLDIAIKRDLDGLHLQGLNLKTNTVTIGADGNLQTGASDLNFDASLKDIALLAEGFNGPATLTGTVRQDGKPWTIDAKAKGPANTTLSLTGTIIADPATADLNIQGDFPLGLADKYLPSNITLNGDGKIRLQMNGPLALSSLSGTISTSSAAVALPTYNVSLTDLSATASLSRGRASIKSTANVTQGGRIVTTGSLDLKAPYTTQLDVTLDKFSYVQQPTIKSQMNGRLSLSGALANSLSLSGDINLIETDLLLAATNSGGRIPDITHTNEPADVRQTRDRAGFVETPEAAKPSGAGIGLNVNIHAPGKIFLRGAGLNAEMQGDLRVTGSTNDIVPIGQFTLIRGYLDLFGRRLDLREGKLFLQGSFAPFFRVVAQTKTDNATVRVTVEGNPDSPDISFSSDPDLPEDEVLAELLFGKSLSEMTPVEAATLAAQVASLAGGGGNRISEHLREDLGLDALGVTTSEDGNLALTAGKYISDNVYADIIVDSEGHSRVDLNMDLNSEFTVRGSTDNRGNTGIGLFFEKDY